MKPIHDRWNGYVEAGDVSEFNFEDQRRTYDGLGYALDPSVAGATSVNAFVGSRDAVIANKGNTYSTAGAVRAKRRRRGKGADANEHKWAAVLPKAGAVTPSEEQLSTLEEWRGDPDEANAKKKAKAKEEKVAETSVLHIKDEVDYLGRTYVMMRRMVVYRVYIVTTIRSCMHAQTYASFPPAHTCMHRHTHTCTHVDLLGVAYVDALTHQQCGLYGLQIHACTI